MVASISSIRAFLCVVLALLILQAAGTTSVAAPKAGAKAKTETSQVSEGSPLRRAFVVGIQDYDDPGITKLTRPVADANDVATVLQDVGFDKKNVKTVTNVKTRADFLKALNDFLKEVKPGDEVVFFFSGHGYGSRKDDSNYLLFSKTKSLNTFTKERLQKSPDKAVQGQAKDQALVRLKAPEYETNYEIEEIQKLGISDTEIATLIEARKPATAILVLDACRTLATKESTKAAAERAGLHTRRTTVPANFAIIYSAADGEAAIESANSEDQRRNSLFTDILRTVMQRPGIDLDTMMRHLKVQVGAVAEHYQQRQRPEMISNLAHPFRFVSSVGADRFPLPEDSDPCWGASADLARVLDDKSAPEDGLITHVNLYPNCPTTDRARSALAEMRRTAGRYRHPVGDCDDLAASPFDPGLRGKPGVPFERIGRLEPPRDHVPQTGEPDQFDTAWVVDVCAKAVKENPRISRYLLDLARAEHAHARNPATPPEERAEYLQRARADYETLANSGDPLAMANLAHFYEYGGDRRIPVSQRRGIDHRKALELLSRAAQQGQPIAQYDLARKYESGYPEADLARDVGELRHWMGLASRANYAPATMKEAAYELEGIGNAGNRNPARAVELYRRVVRQGGEQAPAAEYELGFIYLIGHEVQAENDTSSDSSSGSSSGGSSGGSAANRGKETRSTAFSGQIDPVSVLRDEEQALIWLGRAAAHGHHRATYAVSYLLENARGVPEPQQQLAARYLRAAAEAGFPRAQVKYVEKLLGGEMVLRFENRSAAVDRLLKQAMAAKDGKAALMLAQLSWPNDGRGIRDPQRAAAYAFAAIELAATVDPSDEYFENEFGPLIEIAAGHFLVMLGHEPSAHGRDGGPLFRPEELATLEKYYGTYDETKRRVDVKIASISDFRTHDPSQGLRRSLWLWDWGRKEAPSEQQFRNIELNRGTTYADRYRDAFYRKERADPKKVAENPMYVTQNMVREALAEVYKRSKDYKEPFLNLLGKKLELLGAR